MIGGNFSAQTEREHNWGPASCRNEYEYEQYWSSADAWMNLDGRWHEARDQAKEEIEKIDGWAQNLGFGEFVDHADADILKYKPKYL